jgi:hypothetical protein
MAQKAKKNVKKAAAGTPKKRSPYHLCIDRVLPANLQTKGGDAAFRENESNRPKLPPALAKALSHPGLAIAVLRKNLWQPGRTLKVRFLDGSAPQKQKVEALAHQWSNYANITFTFGDDKNAEIRISFKQEGSWSAVGTDCLVEQYFPKSQPTMNFGWLEDNTDDEEYSRVVLHEFGHALGAIHEHQSPDGGIQWNVPAVMRAFSGPPNNWSPDEIKSNILDKYSKTQTNFTNFDPDSIMLYEFPADLTLNDVGTHSNSKLSSKDRAFMLKTYPK